MYVFFVRMGFVYPELTSCIYVFSETGANVIIPWPREKIQSCSLHPRKFQIQLSNTLDCTFYGFWLRPVMAIFSNVFWDQMIVNCFCKNGIGLEKNETKIQYKTKNTQSKLLG